MCYAKPGPRCSSHAKAILDRAISSGSPTDVLDAMDNYDETPAGHRELKNVVRNATTARSRMNAQSRLSSATERRRIKLNRFAALNDYINDPDNVTGEGTPLFHQQDDTDEELFSAVNAAVAQGSMSYFEPGEYRTFNAPRSSAKKEVGQLTEIERKRRIEDQQLEEKYKETIEKDPYNMPYFVSGRLRKYAIEAKNPEAAYGKNKYDELKSYVRVEFGALNDDERKDDITKDEIINDTIKNNAPSCSHEDQQNGAGFLYHENYALIEQIFEQVSAEGSN